MNFEKLKSNRFFRFVSNRFVLITIIFIVWMTFFDENSFLDTYELDQEIEKLEKDKKHYQSEILKDRKKIENLQTDEDIDKFARERYRMKKENEDIYIIEYDTID